MIMLPLDVDVLEMDDTTVTYRYRRCVGVIENQDVHILDKEFCNE